MSRQSLRPSLLSFVAVLSLVSVVAATDDPVKVGSIAGTAPQPPPTADEIARLVKELDANRFALREAAQQRLAAAGRAAVPELTKAATGDSLEAAMRAIAILRKHLQESDASTRAVAKEALEKIAKCDRPAAASAAAEALKSPPPNQPTTPLQGGIQIDGQFNFQPGGVRSRQFSMRGVNGVKEYDIREDNRTIKIVDDPANGIKIEVTEKKDGKDETKKYEAKNADELKEKHPDAFKIYEENTKQPTGIRIFGGQNPFDGVRPAPPPIPRAILNIFGREFAEPLDRANEQLNDAGKLIKKRLEKDGKNDDLAKALEQLEEAKKQLDEVRAKLRG